MCALVGMQRAMLAQFATRLRRRGGDGQQGEGEGLGAGIGIVGEDGRPVAIEEDCEVSVVLPSPCDFWGKWTVV